MKTGNSVPAANDRDSARRDSAAKDSVRRDSARSHGVVERDDSQLRDIEELVAKLQLVTKQLQFPDKPQQPSRDRSDAYDPREAEWRDEARQGDRPDGKMN